MIKGSEIILIEIARMNKRIFCVDNLETIPNNLIDMICAEKGVFDTWFHKDDGVEYIRSDRSIICHSTKASEIFHSLRYYFSTCMIRAYHATRIIDAREIIECGLIPIEIGKYTERIESVLSDLGVSLETCKLISKEIRIFVETNGRDSNTVSLFNSYHLYDDGYDQFTQNYGGETVRFAIKNKHPEVFKLLCDIGSPVVVSCIFDWNDIEPIYQESYIQTVISAVLSKFILNNGNIEESEVRVNGRIAASCIEKIIGATSESMDDKL